MSVTVWKYVFQVSQLQQVKMPEGARIVHVEEQHGELCFWALVNPAAKMEVRTFAMCGTGDPCPPAEYVGTVLRRGGAFVWHIFEEPRS